MGRASRNKRAKLGLKPRNRSNRAAAIEKHNASVRAHPVYIDLPRYGGYQQPRKPRPL